MFFSPLLHLIDVGLNIKCPVFNPGTNKRTHIPTVVEGTTSTKNSGPKFCGEPLHNDGSSLIPKKGNKLPKKNTQQPQ